MEKVLHHAASLVRGVVDPNHTDLIGSFVVASMTVAMGFLAYVCLFARRNPSVPTHSYRETALKRNSVGRAQDDFAFQAAQSQTPPPPRSPSARTGQSSSRGAQSSFNRSQLPESAVQKSRFENPPNSTQHSRILHEPPVRRESIEDSRRTYGLNPASSSFSPGLRVLTHGLNNWGRLSDTSMNGLFGTVAGLPYTDAKGAVRVTVTLDSGGQKAIKPQNIKTTTTRVCEGPAGTPGGGYLEAVPGLSGRPEGPSRRTFQNGDVLLADIVDGAAHGPGRWIFADGCVDEMTFVGGFPTLLKRIQPNGDTDTFEPEFFRDGKSMRRSKLRYTNGDCEDRLWVEGEVVSRKLYRTDGAVEETAFDAKGMPVGKGKLIGIRNGEKFEFEEGSSQTLLTKTRLSDGSKTFLKGELAPGTYVMPNPKPRLRSRCAGCGKKAQGMLMCPCLKVKYCDRACQVTDRKRHKKTCTYKKRKQDTI